jgi:transcriptional regulator GlxA family with amidase domain
VNTERDADLLFVCAGGNPATFNDKATFAWLRRLARRGMTIGGISGGPYILARAGLLDGHQATLHWEHQPAFSEDFPEIEVMPSLFAINGNRITCSGGISALDMMVALIERDHGHELAAAVGDWFLHTHIREGMGPQRMDLRFRLGVTDEKLLRVLRQMETSIETPQSREDLAGIAGVSLRQLERLFRRQLGRGIHAHYSSMRLERARQLLRETTLPILDVAVATGFASSSQFARAYGRAFGETPTRARVGA